MPTVHRKLGVDGGLAPSASAIPETNVVIVQILGLLCKFLIVQLSLHCFTVLCNHRNNRTRMRGLLFSQSRDS